MKGFARIFEAIVASVILLASLTFFFVPQTYKSEWDNTALQMLAQDTLESAYLNGALTNFVKMDDRTPLNNYIATMLPQTVDFSLEVRGIPNSIIYISCVDCTIAQTSELSAILNPTEFQYKTRNISIRIQNLTMPAAIPEDTNIIFFFDNNDGIQTYQQQINSFLDRGSVFLLSDLAESDVKNKPLGSLFNLTWAGTDAQPPAFDSVSNTSRTAHFVARYYANLTSRNLADVASDSFSSFYPSGIQTGDAKDVVASSRSYVRATQSRGRTVWFSEYNKINHGLPATKSIDNLVKASVMWVSGEKFKLDAIKKYPAPVRLSAEIMVYDGDPYVVELTLWRVFY